LKLGCFRLSVTGCFIPPLAGWDGRDVYFGVEINMGDEFHFKSAGGLPQTFNARCPMTSKLCEQLFQDA
jgi:hypothetical protein